MRASKLTLTPATLLIPDEATAKNLVHLKSMPTMCTRPCWQSPCLYLSSGIAGTGHIMSLWQKPVRAKVPPLPPFPFGAPIAKGWNAASYPTIRPRQKARKLQPPADSESDLKTTNITAEQP